MKDGLLLRDAKVAWVLTILGVDGSLLYQKPLLESLAKQCRSFRVFTAKFQGEKNVIDVDIICCATIKQLYKPERQAKLGKDCYTPGISLVTPSIVPALLKYSPDLIVVNEFSLLSLYSVLAQYLMPGVKLLLLVEARPRLTENPILRLARLALRSFMVKKVDLILTNNEEGKNYCISDLHSRADRVVIKPYTTSDIALQSAITKQNLLEYRSRRGTAPPFHFLYVGQLIQRKGLQHALISLKHLIPKYAGKFVLDVVGDGTFQETLKRQTEKLGLSRHVVFHGRQPYATLWEWYKRADVFLFPTMTDYRALPPFEALSMGLPIVASVHDGGVGETTEEGRNGFSFDPRDHARLAQILSRFIESPDLIAEFSKRSLEMASAYTLERAIESLTYACQQALTS